ncbi:MAG: hypothetical protein A2Z14_06305 [Chloroflexi bacterium RBG_16_48_8]|nr:MAG: hypothetical protein A2Z14_06305 [Chloroflexi bacterium RBG_16_48_8]
MKVEVEMNWEQQTEILRVLQSYAASALVAMLNIHFLTVFLQWLVKRRGWTSDQEKQPNSEFILDF